MDDTQLAQAEDRALRARQARSVRVAVWAVVGAVAGGAPLLGLLVLLVLLDAGWLRALPMGSYADLVAAVCVGGGLVSASAFGICGWHLGWPRRARGRVVLVLVVLAAPALLVALLGASRTGVLHEVAAGGVIALVAACLVALPTSLGMAVRDVVGKLRARSSRQGDVRS